MAEKATVPTIQCSEAAKARFRSAASTLDWDMQAVAELASELLESVVADEETPDQRRARMLSKLGSTPVRHQSNNGATRVAS